ncbi:hypothetical protein RDI61_17885 [Pseudomonas plecoglossicida]|uniref:hypothetical protein n=1 Tax=Pseudomonas putida group TaxID=136845 RepID=UPI0024101639|nr:MULTISPECIES: hypothetical protein [Pseudomonas putida group]MDQ7965899.1 hypothetical protein [Pseudomonas plecoglossicida]WFG01099.1 hypothetical protein P3X84_18415 [Pseudomonas putida]
MAAIPSFRITVADTGTRDICTLYLVGGFDEEKNYYAGHPEFRGSQKLEYRDICHQAERGKILPQEGAEEERDERGDAVAWAQLQMAIVGFLSEGIFEFRGLQYRFQISTIDPDTLDFLTWEVIAQVNEW